MNNWLLLILSLPTENATARMRVWRAVKSCGAIVLRDGVYLLPSLDNCREVFQRLSEEVKQAGGTAYLMEAKNSGEDNLTCLFDRSGDYAQLMAEIETRHRLIENSTGPADTIKLIRKLRKTFNVLIQIDFFPTFQQTKTEQALAELESLAGKLLAPDEPSAIELAIPKLELSSFRNRHWATRQRPWVDRLASAWLIRRHIDIEARFTWLSTSSDCPTDAIGFDFDGAQFTHVGNRVTFETLLASFGLESPALKRLGRLVHYLDVGGIRPAEASGIEQVLTGLLDSLTDDHQLFEAACAVFDGLSAAFQKEEKFNDQIQHSN
jgi:hypothetical protein